MSTYMLAAGTIDEEIYSLIAAKRSVVEAATDGSDGDEVMNTGQIVMNFLSEGLQSEHA